MLGKEVVQEGLNKGIFYQKEDGSVWIDLTADGLDEKLILRLMEQQFISLKISEQLFRDIMILAFLIWSTL